MGSDQTWWKSMVMNSATHWLQLVRGNSMEDSCGYRCYLFNNEKLHLSRCQVWPHGDYSTCLPLIYISWFRGVTRLWTPGMFGSCLGFITPDPTYVHHTFFEGRNPLVQLEASWICLNKGLKLPLELLRNMYLDIDQQIHSQHAHVSIYHLFSWCAISIFEMLFVHVWIFQRLKPGFKRCSSSKSFVRKPVGQKITAGIRSSNFYFFFNRHPSRK